MYSLEVCKLRIMLSVTSDDNCSQNDEVNRSHKDKDNVIYVYIVRIKGFDKMLPKVRFDFAFDDIDR